MSLQVAEAEKSLRNTTGRKELGGRHRRGKERKRKREERGDREEMKEQGGGRQRKGGVVPIQKALVNPQRPPRSGC